MKKYLFIFILSFTVFLLCVQSVFAVASSGSYKVYGGQINPVLGSMSSSVYRVQVGGQPISGAASSATYGNQSGSIFSEEVTALHVSGSSGSGLSDTIGPIIENIVIYPVSEDQIMIVVTTNELAVTSVEYGVTNSAELYTTDKEEYFRRDHGFVLTELIEGTEYTFVIYAKDVAQNITITDLYTFMLEPQEEVLFEEIKEEVIEGEIISEKIPEDIIEQIEKIDEKVITEEGVIDEEVYYQLPEEARDAIDVLIGIETDVDDADIVLKKVKEKLISYPQKTGIFWCIWAWIIFLILGIITIYFCYKKERQ